MVAGAGSNAHPIWAFFKGLWTMRAALELVMAAS